MKTLPIVVAFVVLMAQAGPRISYMRAASRFIPVASATTSALNNGLLTLSQSGMASWYGVNYDGRQTASGEPYNMSERTAAHHNLPFGTWVRVTNLRTGHSIIVRINDRIPARNRTCIIDLSYFAARALRIERSGLQRVALNVVHAPTYRSHSTGLSNDRPRPLAYRSAILVSDN